FISPLLAPRLIVKRNSLSVRTPFFLSSRSIPTELRWICPIWTSTPASFRTYAASPTSPNGNKHGDFSVDSASRVGARSTNPTDAQQERKRTSPRCGLSSKLTVPLERARHVRQTLVSDHGD